LKDGNDKDSFVSNDSNHLEHFLKDGNGKDSLAPQDRNILASEGTNGTTKIP